MAEDIDGSGASIDGHHMLLVGAGPGLGSAMARRFAEGLGVRMSALYRGHGAPGVVVYNAVIGAPDQLLSSSVAHLQTAYTVDVIGAIVVAQIAAPAMRAAGFGTILFTGGGFADHRSRRLPPFHLARPRCGRRRPC